MEEKQRPRKLVFKLPKKATAEVEVQKEPDPVVSTENMEKLQNGSEDCDKERRSSGFRIKLRFKLKKHSQETNNDQEQLPTVEKVSQEHSKDQEQQMQSRVGKVSKENSNDQELQMQSRAEKVSEEARNDEEEQKITETAENLDVEKMAALDGESSENFKLNEAEERGQRKRGFTLALSKEEIEEDIIEFLGSKTTSKKKAKKRASEDPLNHLFPAAWMETLIDY